MSVEKHNALAPEILRALISGCETRVDALIVLESLIVGVMLYHFPGNPRGQAEVVESVTDRVLGRLTA